MLWVLGVFLGLVMWGAGLGWLVLAATSIASTQTFPFNMGWWGFTFPLGVFASCTGLLAEELDSIFFRVLTMVRFSPFPTGLLLARGITCPYTLRADWTGLFAAIRPSRSSPSS